MYNRDKLNDINLETEIATIENISDNLGSSEANLKCLPIIARLLLEIKKKLDILSIKPKE